MKIKAFSTILEPDPRFVDMQMVDAETGVLRQMAFEDHYNAVIDIKLTGPVPVDVQSSFDRARSAMVYAFFDYELLVVGEVQAFGSFELALKHRLDGHGGLSSGTLRNLVERARKNCVLPKVSDIGASSGDPIDALIHMRNGLSHGTCEIHSPSMALSVLQACGAWIDYIQIGSNGSTA